MKDGKLFPMIFPMMMMRTRYELEGGPPADKLSPFIRLLPLRPSIDDDHDDEIMMAKKSAMMKMKMLSNPFHHFQI